MFTLNTTCTKSPKLVETVLAIVESPHTQAYPVGMLETLVNVVGKQAASQSLAEVTLGLNPETLHKNKKVGFYIPYKESNTLDLDNLQVYGVAMEFVSVAIWGEDMFLTIRQPSGTNWDLVRLDLQSCVFEKDKDYEIYTDIIDSAEYSTMFK